MQLRNIYCISAMLTFSFSILSFCIYPLALGKRQAVVSKEELEDREKMRKGEPVVIQLRDFLQYSGSFASKKTWFLSVNHSVMDA